MKKVNYLLICLLAGLLISACDSINLEADGSGDYPSLEEAVQHAPEGAAVVLGPGTYHLAEPLDVGKSLHLKGAGMDRTEIVSEAEDYVVRFNGDGSFAAEGITFRHKGKAVADVVVVQGGEVTFTRCRFAGAYVEGEEISAGLWLQGNTTGVVQDCVAAENDNVGILLEYQAQLTLEGNVCKDNEEAGIAYAGDASGIAHKNKCSENGFGILVSGQAQPTLEENVCTNNGGGIVYSGGGGGVARRNECSGNGSGIGVFELARPTLEENTCTDNELAGIYYLGFGGGVARQNKCSENGVGVIVERLSQPTLEGNICTDNITIGIAYSDQASGVARRNECSGNQVGIAAAQQAQPTLEGNICMDNKLYGIFYEGNTGGVARQNECSRNGVGIALVGSTDPDLVDNNCHDNIEEDIQDRRP